MPFFSGKLNQFLSLVERRDDFFDDIALNSEVWLSWGCLLVWRKIENINPEIGPEADLTLVEVREKLRVEVNLGDECDVGARFHNGLQVKTKV